MYISELFIPITKNLPTEAKIKSHQLMIRTGMIKAIFCWNIYSWLTTWFQSNEKNRTSCEGGAKSNRSSGNVNANNSIFRNMEREREI